MMQGYCLISISTYALKKWKKPNITCAFLQMKWLILWNSLIHLMRRICKEDLVSITGCRIMQFPKFCLTQRRWMTTRLHRKWNRYWDLTGVRHHYNNYDHGRTKPERKDCHRIG